VGCRGVQLRTKVLLAGHFQVAILGWHRRKSIAIMTMDAPKLFTRIKRLHFPFWKARAQEEGPEIDSYADLLMGESDHRIRNNLQMILSVIRAAQRATESHDVQAAFEDIVHKMQAVLQAQLTLERVRGADSFSADQFLRDLCANLRAASPAEFSLQVNCETVYLPRKLAMPLALIANELVTNAIKYGLTGEQRRVQVSLLSAYNDLELRVEDDGPGIDEALLQNSQSGLRTVRYLASQMRGEVIAGPGPGAHVIVRFENPAR